MKKRIDMDYIMRDKKIQWWENIGCIITPWHEAQAIARARAFTRANQEKGGLGER